MESQNIVSLIGEDGFERLRSYLRLERPHHTMPHQFCFDLKIGRDAGVKVLQELERQGRARLFSYLYEADSKHDDGCPVASVEGYPPELEFPYEVDEGFSFETRVDMIYDMGVEFLYPEKDLERRYLVLPEWARVGTILFPVSLRGSWVIESVDVNVVGVPLVSLRQGERLEQISLLRAFGDDEYESDLDFAVKCVGIELTNSLGFVVDPEEILFGDFIYYLFDGVECGFDTQTGTWYVEFSVHQSQSSGCIEVCLKVESQYSFAEAWDLFKSSFKKCRSEMFSAFQIRGLEI